MNLPRKKSETFLLAGPPSIAKKSLHINIWVPMQCSSHWGTDQFSLIGIGRVFFRIGPYIASIPSPINAFRHTYHRLLLFSAESCFDSLTYLHALWPKLFLFNIWHFKYETFICFILQRQQPFWGNIKLWYVIGMAKRSVHF